MHAFVEFIDIAEHFALFVAESFEFSFEFFALLIVCGGAEFGFELFESFVDGLLALREFFESVEDLELFALLRGSFLLFLSLSFGFVAVAVVIKFELLELLLRGAVTTAPSPTLLLLLLLLLSNLIFRGAHFKEGLEGTLFWWQSGAWFCGRIVLSGLQQLCCLLHVCLGFLCERGELGCIGCLFE